MEGFRNEVEAQLSGLIETTQQIREFEDRRSFFTVGSAIEGHINNSPSARDCRDKTEMFVTYLTDERGRRRVILLKFLTEAAVTSADFRTILAEFTSGLDEKKKRFSGAAFEQLLHIYQCSGGRSDNNNF